MWTWFTSTSNKWKSCILVLWIICKLTLLRLATNDLPWSFLYLCIFLQALVSSSLHFAIEIHWDTPLARIFLVWNWTSNKFIRFKFIFFNNCIAFYYNIINNFLTIFHHNLLCNIINVKIMLHNRIYVKFHDIEFKEWVVPYPYFY